MSRQLKIISWHEFEQIRLDNIIKELVRNKRTTYNKSVLLCDPVLKLTEGKKFVHAH